MGRNKLKRMAAANKLPNIYAADVARHFRGCWAPEVFRNNSPITLELGCGKGEFSLEMARRYPERNFIDVDYKGYILWKGGFIALEESLDNVRLLRVRIQNITDFFERHEVDEIWFVHPDPFPKARHEKHRLLYPGMFPLYRQILKPGGYIHLKTDSRLLFDYTCEVLAREGIPIDETAFYNESGGPADHQICTTYERKFIKAHGQINYVRFHFPD